VVLVTKIVANNIYNSKQQVEKDRFSFSATSQTSKVALSNKVYKKKNKI
jgi:hypothetical protein